MKAHNVIDYWIIYNEEVGGMFDEGAMSIVGGTSVVIGGVTGTVPVPTAGKGGGGGKLPIGGGGGGNIPLTAPLPVASWRPMGICGGGNEKDKGNGNVKGRGWGAGEGVAMLGTLVWRSVLEAVSGTDTGMDIVGAGGGTKLGRTHCRIPESCS